MESTAGHWRRLGSKGRGSSAETGELIETSAYRGLIITPDTQISALAPAGKAGTWLIDPIYNIRIVDGLGVTNNQDAPGFEPNGDDSIIGATLIVNRLNAGTNVTISTTSAFGSTIGTGTQAGNISVEGAIQKTAGGPAEADAERRRGRRSPGLYRGRAPAVDFSEQY